MRLFISYAHRDQPLREHFERHLAALKLTGHVTAWHDRRILAGDEIGDEIGDVIDRNLELADVVLLLVSANFLASEYCSSIEMKRAMQRRDSGDARVIPVILRPCDWQGTVLGKLLAVPLDGKAVTLWRDRDAAFLNVIQALRKLSAGT